MNIAKLHAEFQILKNRKDLNGLLKLRKKINKGRDLSRARQVTNRVIEELRNERFALAINAVSPLLEQTRGVAIVAISKARNNNSRTSPIVVSLVKNGTKIAEMEADAYTAENNNGVAHRILELESGWTLANYSKTGPMRPVNGPGYGTILRALIVAVAKKEGFSLARQESAIVSQENKQKFANGKINRPVSAWIMNKLGFGINSVSKLEGTNRITGESRSLNLRKATPKLDAVVREILGGQGIAPNRRRWWAPCIGGSCAVAM